MRRQDKADRIGQMLDELYTEIPIPLDHYDAFSLLVAVLLSAQSTDKKVNEITPALFAAAPTPADMAKLDVETIAGYIRQIGLAPTKAKNIKALSTILIEKYDGEVPEALDALEALPGVGHKTASVVVSQAFGVPAFPVDTHIHRLAARWGLSSGRNVETTEKDLKKLFPRETWNRRHLQIIFFGREYCPARHHDLATCPICGWASSKKRQQEERLKNASKKSSKGTTGKRSGRRLR